MHCGFMWPVGIPICFSAATDSTFVQSRKLCLPYVGCARRLWWKNTTQRIMGALVPGPGTNIGCRNQRHDWIMQNPGPCITNVFATRRKEFQPMVSQLSKKAALPLAKILATCRNNVSNTGPWDEHVGQIYPSPWSKLDNWHESVDVWPILQRNLVQLLANCWI